MTFLRLLTVLFCAMLFLSCSKKPNIVETDKEGPSVEVPEVVVQTDTEPVAETTAEKAPVAEVSKTKEMVKPPVATKEESPEKTMTSGQQVAMVRPSLATSLSPLRTRSDEEASAEPTEVRDEEASAEPTEVRDEEASAVRDEEASAVSDEEASAVGEETQVAMVERPSLATSLSPVETRDEEAPSEGSPALSIEDCIPSLSERQKKITEAPIRGIIQWAKGLFSSEEEKKPEATCPPPAVSVCDRSPDVRTAILDAVNRDYQDCDKIVTAAELTLIEELDLSNKQLQELKEGDFDGLVNLEELILYRNELTTLPEEIFAGLSNLKHLSLYKNNLKELSKEHLKDLNNLEYLSIHNNEISRLPKDIFEGTPNLEKLFIYSNQLTKIDPETFSYMPYLRELKLDNNPISSEPEVGVFAGLNYLEWLSLEVASFMAEYSDEEKELLRDRIKQESGSDKIKVYL